MSVSLYVLIDPRDESVFYVGISVNPRNRMRNHLRVNNRAYKVNPGKARKIRQIKKAGLLPRMEIVDVLPESRIAQAEQDWIFFLSRSFELVNLSLGGGVHSSETRKRMSESQRRRMSNPELRAKLSKHNSGKEKSAETRAKISASGKGLRRSEETRRRISESKKEDWKRRKAQCSS